MNKLSNSELEKVQGGFSAWMALGIAATVIFLSGVFEGIVHPKSCSAQ